VAVGIGITTRNRPDILRACLAHFTEFDDGNTTYVVVDDASDLPRGNEAIVQGYSNHLNITYVPLTPRGGIARAKNACLLALQDCEDVFLFDDDAWPRRNGWAEDWVATCRANNIGHSMFITGLPEHNPVPFFIAVTIGEGRHRLHAWSNCMGPVLYFSRDCLNALGGYDVDGSANPYGYEHAQMSVRAAEAGYTNGHRYLSPANVDELIYSLDVHYGIYKEPVPLPRYGHLRFRSSVTPEEMAGAASNTALMEDPAIYIPLTP
jgi:glycosyltransferase involved in cell wall biosynthesis